MNIQHITNVLLAVAFAIALGFSHLLDGPSDIDAAQSQFMSLQDVMKAAGADARLMQFASKVCGVNAAYKLLDDGAVQCYTHKGRKTALVPAGMAGQGIAQVATK